MKIVAMRTDNREEAAIATESGFVQIRTLNETFGTTWSENVLGLLEKAEITALNNWYKQIGNERLSELSMTRSTQIEPAPLYRRPRKIWGIGANYREKATHMGVTPPADEPICFLKPDTTLIGPGESIILPSGIGRITAEAEIGIVIGRTCKNVSEVEAPNFVAGFTATLDMTAQDIHARNPRFIGRSKSFDTFFSLGHELMIFDASCDWQRLKVVTALNGKEIHSSDISHMIYSPWLIVSYFSHINTLLPGDIIMTGTPGSVDLAEGDTAECWISGFEPLMNPVIRETTAY